MRALDYLQSRQEVDPERLGVTGRSGGGAYSWWIAAIDERIKCAVPVAGITDLKNHVVDGCVEGHCDCMYMVNTYRWDYPQVAALVAPRPLLIANTDNDRIFPLDGVYRTFETARRLYRLHEPVKKGASADVALNITAGGHMDTQELQTHAFRWLNHYLKKDDSLIDSRAPKFFENAELKVFATLPTDEINTKIHETFVTKAPPAEVPADKAAWETMRKGWLTVLEEKSFRGWPDINKPIPRDPAPVRQVRKAEKDGVTLTTYDFVNFDSFLQLHVLHRTGLEKPELNVLNVLDDKTWPEFLATVRPAFETELQGEELPPGNKESWESTVKMFKTFPWVMSYVAPRGVGPTAFNQDEKKQIQIRRRFYLIGQTLDGQQVWDVRRAIQATREIESLKEVPLWLQSHRNMAGVTLYASLFEDDIKRIDLYELPTSHREGPIFFNVERYLDMPQALAMAAERTRVILYQDDPAAGWQYPRDVAAKLGWDAKQLQFRKKPAQ